MKLASLFTPGERIHIAIYIIYIVGGLLMGAALFDRQRVRSRWARLACMFSACALMFVGIAELLRHYHFWVLGPDAERGLYSTLWLLRGVALGLLVLLGICGELRTKTPNQAMQRTAPRSDA